MTTAAGHGPARVGSSPGEFSESTPVCSPGLWARAGSPGLRARVPGPRARESKLELFIETETW